VPRTLAEAGTEGALGKVTHSAEAGLPRRSYTARMGDC